MTSPRSRRAAGWWATATIVLACLVGTVGSASADAPLDVTGPVTDPAGVLGDRTAEVRAALDKSFDRSGLQLFVVLVPGFDGMDGQQWADRTAEISNVSDDDIVLAIATDDRAYGYSVADGHPLSDRDLERVEREDLLPRLRDEDWAGAAIAAAQGYADAAESGFPWGTLALGGVAVAGAGALAAGRRRRAATTAESLEEIDARCAATLLRIDDRLTTTEQEIGFAEAQFGTEATRAFRAALADARVHAQEAFAAQQLLDDGTPETTDEHRRICTHILHLCTQAEEVVRAQSEAFDVLRERHTAAPQVLAGIDARAAEVTARLTTSRAVLERLAADHPASDLASVADHVSRAETLAAGAVQQARLGTSVVETDRATAVVHATAAEESLTEATALLDALDRADADLDAAPSLIAQLETSLTRDLDDAARIAADDPAVQAAAEDARTALAGAEVSDRDPLLTVTQLRSAESALDRLLDPIRTAASAAAAEAEAERQRRETEQRRDTSGSGGSIFGGGTSSRRRSSTRRRSSSRRSSKGRRGGGGRF